MTLRTKSDFLRGADQVLRQNRRPMRPRDIWNVGTQAGIFSDRLAGKTPWQTLKSKLSVHILVEGESSHFIRTAPGVFYLRDLMEAGTAVFHAPRQQHPGEGEVVLTFPSSALDRAGRFQGIRGDSSRYRTLLNGPLVALPRREAESRDDVKQFLVYIAVTRGRNVLKYRRGAYSLSDKMLHGADCIGFGGHVDVNDTDVFSSTSVGIFAAAARELAEELALPQDDRDRLLRSEGLSILGYINDDSSPVGRRHFAVVMQYEVSQDPTWLAPQRGEKSINQLAWLDLDSTNLDIEGFEYWSQLLLRRMFPRTLRKQRDYRVARRTPFREPNVLVVVGQVGSGKSEAAEHLCREHGYSKLNSGQVLARLLGIPPVPITPRSEFQRRAQEFIEEPDGPSRLAADLVESAERLGGNVLVDGIRQLETLRELRRGFRRSRLRMAVLFVQTTPDTAFKFFRKREAPDSDMMHFLAVRDAEVEREVPLLLREADAVLYNWADRETYAASVRALMRDVLEPARPKNAGGRR